MFKIINSLEEICQLLNQSALAYQSYLQNGKTYSHACELKKFNSRIRLLLAEKLDDFPVKIQSDACDLIAHYDAWTEKWEELEAQLRPVSTDLFVFENSHHFPRDAAKNLEQELNRYKQDARFQ